MIDFLTGITPFLVGFGYSLVSEYSAGYDGVRTTANNILTEGAKGIGSLQKLASKLQAAKAKSPASSVKEIEAQLGDINSKIEQARFDAAMAEAAQRYESSMGHYISEPTEARMKKMLGQMSKADAMSWWLKDAAEIDVKGARLDRINEALDKYYVFKGANDPGRLGNLANYDTFKSMASSEAVAKSSAYREHMYDMLSFVNREAPGAVPGARFWVSEGIGVEALQSDSARANLATFVQGNDSLVSSFGTNPNATIMDMFHGYQAENQTRLARKLYDAVSMQYDATVRGKDFSASIGAFQPNYSVGAGADNPEILQKLRELKLDQTETGRKLLGDLEKTYESSRIPIKFFDIQDEAGKAYQYMEISTGKRGNPIYQFIDPEFGLGPEAQYTSSRAYRRLEGSGAILKNVVNLGGMERDSRLLLLQDLAANGRNYVSRKSRFLFNQLLEQRTFDYQDLIDRVKNSPIDNLAITRGAIPLAMVRESDFFFNHEKINETLGQLNQGGWSLAKSSRKSVYRILQPTGNTFNLSTELSGQLEKLGWELPENVPIFAESEGLRNVKLPFAHSSKNMVDTLMDSVVKDQFQAMRAYTKTQNLLVTKGDVKWPEFDLSIGVMDNRELETMRKLAKSAVTEDTALYKEYLSSFSNDKGIRKDFASWSKKALKRSYKDIIKEVQSLQGLQLAPEQLVARQDKIAADIVERTGVLERQYRSYLHNRKDLSKDLRKVALKMFGEGTGFQDKLIAMARDGSLTGKAIAHEFSAKMWDNSAMRATKVSEVLTNFARTLSGSGGGAIDADFLAQFGMAKTKSYTNVVLADKIAYSKEIAENMKAMSGDIVTAMEAGGSHVEAIDAVFAKRMAERKGVDPDAVFTVIKREMEKFKRLSAYRTNSWRLKSSIDAVADRISQRIVRAGEIIGEVEGGGRKYRATADKGIRDVEIVTQGMKSRPGLHRVQMRGLIDSRTANVTISGAEFNRSQVESLNLKEALSTYIQSLRSATGAEAEAGKYAERADMIQKAFFDGDDLKIHQINPEGELDFNTRMHRVLKRNLQTVEGGYYASSVRARASIWDVGNIGLGTQGKASVELIQTMRNTGLGALVPTVLKDVEGYSPKRLDFVTSLAKSIESGEDTMSHLQALDASQIADGKFAEGYASRLYQEGWKYKSRSSGSVLADASDLLLNAEKLSEAEMEMMNQANMFSHLYSPGTETGIKDAIARANQKAGETGLYIPKIDATIARAAKADVALPDAVARVKRMMEKGQAPSDALLLKLKNLALEYSRAVVDYSKIPQLGYFGKGGALRDWGTGIGGSFYTGIRPSSLEDVGNKPIAEISIFEAKKAGLSQTQIEKALANEGRIEGMALLGYRDPITHAGLFEARINADLTEGYARVTKTPLQHLLADFDKDRMVWKFMENSKLEKGVTLESLFEKQAQFYQHVKDNNMMAAFKDEIKHTAANWGKYEGKTFTLNKANFYDAQASEELLRIVDAEGMGGEKTWRGAWEAFKGNAETRPVYEQLLNEVKEGVVASNVSPAKAAQMAERQAMKMFMANQLSQFTGRRILTHAAVAQSANVKRVMEMLTEKAGTLSEQGGWAINVLAENIQQIPIKAMKHVSNVQAAREFGSTINAIQDAFKVGDIGAMFAKIGSTSLYKDIINNQWAKNKDGALRNALIASGVAESEVQGELAKAYFKDEMHGNLYSTLEDFVNRDSDKFKEITERAYRVMGRKGGIASYAKGGEKLLGADVLETLEGMGLNMRGIATEEIRAAQAVRKIAKGPSLMKRVLKHPATAIGAVASVAALGVLGMAQSPDSEDSVLKGSRAGSHARGVAEQTNTSQLDHARGGSSSELSANKNKIDPGPKPAFQRLQGNRDGRIEVNHNSRYGADTNMLAKSVTAAYPSKRVNITVQNDHDPRFSQRTTRRLKGLS